TAGNTQDPIANGDDEAGLLGFGNELRRAEEAPVRMLPAQQRLGSYDPGFAEGDLGLVPDLQLRPLQGSLQRGPGLRANGGCRPLDPFAFGDVAEDPAETGRAGHRPGGEGQLQ